MEMKANHLQNNLFAFINEYNQFCGQLEAHFDKKVLVPTTIMTGMQSFLNTINSNLILITKNANHVMKRLNSMQTQIDSLTKSESKLKKQLECVRGLYSTAKNDMEWEQMHRQLIEEENKSLSLMTAKLVSIKAVNFSVSQLLWKCTQEENVVQSIIQSDVAAFHDMLSCSIDCLLKFTSTLSDTQLESSENIEIITCLCGIITNISASRVGIEEVSKCQNAHQLIHALFLIVKSANALLPVKLKTNSLLALYNISLSPDGHKLISQNVDLIQVLAHFILHSNTNIEHRLISVKFINSLLREQQNVEIIRKIKATLPVTQLQTLLLDPMPNMRQACARLMGEISIYLQVEL